MLISPAKERALDSRVSSVLSTIDGRLVIVGMESGHTLILGADLETQSEFSTAKGMKCRAMHPAGVSLVLSDNATLRIVQMNGRTMHEEKTTLYSGEGFDGATFSRDGEALWIIRHVEDCQVVLERRETKSWRVVRQTTIAEPAPPTAFFVDMHPEQRVLSLWAAAGQDGQWVYWAYDDGSEIHVVEAPELVFTTPPVFHPAGGEFLLVQGECSEKLRRLTFPGCEELGSLSWEEEPDHLGYSLAYLSDKDALFQSSEGRLFLFDLRTMQIREEVELKGHESRPTNELYPTLQDERGLCSDMRWLHLLETGEIISAHRQTPVLTGDWRDTLVVWGRSSLRGSSSLPDRSCPHTAALLRSHGWK